MFKKIFNISFIVRIFVILSLSLCLFSVSCWDPEYELLGKWRAEGSRTIKGIEWDVTITSTYEDDYSFKEIGDFTSQGYDGFRIIVRGEYDIKEEGKIKITLNDSTVYTTNVEKVEISTNITFEYKLDYDQLTLIDENGSETTYTKL